MLLIGRFLVGLGALFLLLMLLFLGIPVIAIAVVVFAARPELLFVLIGGIILSYLLGKKILGD